MLAAGEPQREARGSHTGGATRGDFSSLRSRHWFYLGVLLHPSLRPRHWRGPDANWIVSIAHGVLWAPHMADVWKPAWTSIACTKPAWRCRDKAPAPSPDFVPHQGEWDLERPQSQL